MVGMRRPKTCKVEMVETTLDTHAEISYQALIESRARIRK
jgi:hypothetical protein